MRGAEGEGEGAAETEAIERRRIEVTVKIAAVLPPLVGSASTAVQAAAESAGHCNLPNAFCKVSVGQQEHKTVIIKHSCAPSWEEAMTLEAPMVVDDYGRQMLDPEAEMRVVVYSHDHLSHKGDTFLGAIAINLHQLRINLRMEEPAPSAGKEAASRLGAGDAAATAAAACDGGMAAPQDSGARLEMIEAFARYFPLLQTADKGAHGAAPGGPGAMSLSATGGVAGTGSGGDLLVDGVFKEYVIPPVDDHDQHHRHRRHHRGTHAHTVHALRLVPRVLGHHACAAYVVYLA